MKIVILTKNEKLYSCKSIYKEAYKRKHIIDIINPALCYMIIKNNKKYSTSLYYKNKVICDYDAVISRINPNNFYNISILKFFETNGCYLLNSSKSILQARNKFYTLQLLSSKGINVPFTVFSSFFNENINDVLDNIGIPLIIKFVNGTQGIGVILAESKKSAISIIESFHSTNTDILIQEYIMEANFSDIRCLVIGNNVVGSIERIAKYGDFRSNLHRGGISNPIKLTDLEKKIAIKSANILGLNLAGIDILRSSRGPLVLEVNASPGIGGIEETLKINISSLIIKFIEQKKITAK